MPATRESSRCTPQRWLAVRLAAPLLAFAAMRCGGKAQHSEPTTAEASGGGGGSSGASTQNGWNQFGSAGTSDEHLIVIPDGGASGTFDCNTISDWSPRVISAVIGSDPPAPQGGTISNGFYRLSKVEYFIGPDGDSSRYLDQLWASLYVSASTDLGADLQIKWEWLDGELPIPVEQSQTIVITGTSYAYAVTCTTDRGSMEPGSIAFTATPNELVWIVPGADGNTRVSTFTRE